MHPGGPPIWNRRGCSSEILNLTPKGDHLGVAQAFCDPEGRPIWAWLMQILTPKRNRLITEKKRKKENLTSVSLRVILCFLAEPYTRPWWLKILALCPEHPKQDQNPKFTPLSEMTSIPVCFIYESPPPPGGMHP